MTGVKPDHTLQKEAPRATLTRFKQLDQAAAALPAARETRISQSRAHAEQGMIPNPKPVPAVQLAVQAASSNDF